MLAAPAPSAQANWLTHIVREAGEAGGKAGRAASHLDHLGPVSHAAKHLRELSGAPKGTLAAHATPEGHWQFVNREGQTFTAGTADELTRVKSALVPGADADTKLTLYLSEDSVFANRAGLDGLPPDATLHVVTDFGALPLTRTGTGATRALSAQYKPGLTLPLSDHAMFREAAHMLGRRLNKSNVRTVAFEPGAPKYLSSAPKLDPASKIPAVDKLDPANLSAALGSVRGQLVVVTGRVENGRISFAPEKGAAFTRDISELATAAAQNDVQLVILHTDTARQAGSRNWLWQSAEIGGFTDAANAATFGDFLATLAAKRGGFAVSAADDVSGRIHVSAVADRAGIGDSATSTVGDLVSHVTGEAVTKGAEVFGRDEKTDKELNARFIPGIPSGVQIMYVIGFVAGLIGWHFSRGWWARLWPRAPADAASGVGLLARVVRPIPRELAFFLVFMPLAGIPALIAHAAVSAYETVMAPFRWIKRRFLTKTL